MEEKDGKVEVEVFKPAKNRWMMMMGMIYGQYLDNMDRRNNMTENMNNNMNNSMNNNMNNLCGYYG